MILKAKFDCSSFVGSHELLTTIYCLYFQSMEVQQVHHRIIAENLQDLLLNTRIQTTEDMNRWDGQNCPVFKFKVDMGQ